MTDIRERPAGTDRQSASGAPSRPRARRRTVWAWPLLVAPVAIYLLVSQIYPLIDTVRLSLYRDRGDGSSREFVGLGNFRDLITDDPNFWPIVEHSLFWVLGATALQMVAGVAAAMVLNQKLRHRGLWRGLFMTPWITPVVVTAIAWRWIFDGSFGLLNHYLQTLHLTDGSTLWLGDSLLVWPSLLLTSTWKGMPFVALMVLAGLQGISREVLEAAAVDGANAWQRFWYVQLPLLKNVLYVTGLIAIVTSWFKFDLIWALTNGGPGYRTSILPTYVYSLGFQTFDFGSAAAVATLAMLLVALVVAAYAVLFRRSNVD